MGGTETNLRVGGAEFNARSLPPNMLPTVVGTNSKGHVCGNKQAPARRYMAHYWFPATRSLPTLILTNPNRPRLPTGKRVTVVPNWFGGLARYSISTNRPTGLAQNRTRRSNSNVAGTKKMLGKLSPNEQQGGWYRLPTGRTDRDGWRRIDAGVGGTNSSNKVGGTKKTPASNRE